MKLFSPRILLNAAAALSLLVSASSCIKVTPDSGDQAEHYIGFTSSVETKVPVESSANMKEFAVWAAYYIDGTLDHKPMEGIRVYHRDGLWMYDDLQMWQEGDWHFEAFYPHPSDLSATQAVVGEEALDINFTAPHDNSQITESEGLTINYYYGPNASYDLMTAEADRSYPADGGNAVQFTFSHLLSRVSIAVKTTTDDVALKSLTFGGMSVLGAYNTVGHSGQWQLLTDFKELSKVPAGSFSDLNDNIPSPLPSDGTSVDVLSDLLLIPQTPETAQVEVTYTIGADGSGAGTPETKSLTLPADPVWQPGRHYRYTLTLGGADVTLIVKIIDWNERNFSVEF